MSFYLRLTLLLIAVCVGVFILPFYFPLHTNTVSASYDYHFNNLIATIALGLCLGLAIGLFYKEFGERLAPLIETDWIYHPGVAKLSRKSLWLAIGLFSVVTLILYLFNANYGYGEEGYFLYRIDRLRLHQTPYRDFEYAYGILFIYLPYYINQLIGTSSAIPGYYTSQIILNSLGLGLLFFCINSFDLTLKAKRFIFYALVLCFIPYQNGLNASIFRYILPVTAILMLFRYQHRLLPRDVRTSLVFAALATLAIACCFAVSLEIGVALLAAVLAFLGYSGLIKKKILTTFLAFS